MSEEITDEGVAAPAPEVAPAAPKPVTVRGGLVELGEWNHSIIVLGVPGSGKTVHATRRLMELGQTPAYKLAHDPAWRMPKRMPDGATVPMLRHSNITAARDALRTHPAHIHAITTGDGAEVLAFAEQLAKASLQRHGGERGVPVVVLLDEGVATRAADPYRIGHGLRSFVAERRGKHVALIMTAQDPSYIHYSLYTLSTELVLFRIRDMDAIGKLTRKFGLDNPGRVAALPNYEHIDLVLG